MIVEEIRVEELFEILKDLVKIPSFSEGEKEIALHIRDKYCRDGGWVAEVDDLHNIYIRRRYDDGTERLPILNAHLDVSPNGDSVENRRLLAEEDFLSLADDNVVKKHEIQAGFDDKTGVAMILYMMTRPGFEHLRFRVLFVAQEERASKPRFGRAGGGGIDFALAESFTSVFKNTSCVITLDRGQATDVIVEYGNIGRTDRPKVRLCSKDFENRLVSCSEEAGYPMKVVEGRMGDSYNIRRDNPGLDCVNLSCGVYDEHHPDESLNIGEAMGVMRVVARFLETYCENTG